MKTSGKLLMAIAAGAAVGAILGVLFAPDKGTETRRKIKQKGKKIKDDVKDAYGKGKEKINHFKEDIGNAIREKVEGLS